MPQGKDQVFVAKLESLAQTWRRSYANSAIPIERPMALLLVRKLRQLLLRDFEQLSFVLLLDRLIPEHDCKASILNFSNM